MTVGGGFSGAPSEIYVEAFVMAKSKQERGVTPLCGRVPNARACA